MREYILIVAKLDKGFDDILKASLNADQIAKKEGKRFIPNFNSYTQDDGSNSLAKTVSVPKVENDKEYRSKLTES